MNTDQKTPYTECATLYHGTLLTSDAPIEIIQLDKKHLPNIIALHNQAIDMLSEQEKAFMLRKPASFFQEHFNRGGGNTVIGIVHNGKLVAESIILNPSATHPKTGMTDMPPVAAPSDVSVLQGVTVLPSYRKNGLMHRMVHTWLNHTVMNDKTHVLAEVDVKNIASWAVFLDEGLKIPSIGLDPNDGTFVYNMHGTIPDIMTKRLSNTFNQMAAGDKTCCIHDIEKQKSMLNDGHEIVGWNKSTKEMILRSLHP